MHYNYSFYPGPLGSECIVVIVRLSVESFESKSFIFHVYIYHISTDVIILFSITNFGAGWVAISERLLNAMDINQLQLT